MPAPPPTPLFVFRGDVGEVHCLLFHQMLDKDILFTGTADGLVHIWDLATNKKLFSFKTSDLACLSLHFIDSYLLTQDKNCVLKMWNVSIESYACIYEKNFDHISFCKIDVLRNELAVPQPNAVVVIHEFVSTSTHPVASLKYSDASVKLGEVLQLKFFDHLCGLCVAVVYENGSLVIWDVEKLSIVSSMAVTNETPMAFDFDVEKLQGVCGSNGKNLVFFKLDEQLQLSKKKEVEIANDGVGCLRVRPDRKVLAAGCWDGKIRIFSWKTCKLLASLDSHRASVLDVAFSFTKNPQLLAAAASDKKISLWSIYE